MGAGGGGSQRVAQAWHGRNTPQRYGRSIADGYTGSTDGEAAFIRDRDLIMAPSGAHPRHGGWERRGKDKVSILMRIEQGGWFYFGSSVNIKIIFEFCMVAERG